jgi:hypothetical protein
LKRRRFFIKRSFPFRRKAGAQQAFSAPTDTQDSSVIPEAICADVDWFLWVDYRLSAKRGFEPAPFTPVASRLPRAAPARPRLDRLDFAGTNAFSSRLPHLKMDPKETSNEEANCSYRVHAHVRVGFCPNDWRTGSRPE